MPGTDTNPASAELMGSGMVHVDVRIAKRDVVWLRAIIEAHEGLGFIFSEGKGVVHVVSTADQADELNRLLDALATEAQLVRIGASAP